MNKIIIDIDNTTIDSTNTLVNIHNYRFPNNKYLNINKNCGWDFDGMLPHDLSKDEINELLSGFVSKLFYKDGIIILEDDVIEVINELSSKYEVIFCSKQHIERSNRTIKFLNKVFPKTKYVRTNTFDKGELFNSSDNDIVCVIDDRIDCLLSFKDVCDNLICYGDYQWNEDWNGKRLNNWKDIYKFL